ncbi:hypothetical protein ACOME3_007846 [Neoechinorhynchus agilis]
MNSRRTSLGSNAYIEQVDHIDPFVSIDETDSTVRICLVIENLVVKRTIRSLFHRTPSNAKVNQLLFESRSFNFEMEINIKDRPITKSYVHYKQKQLPGSIDPKKCSVSFRTNMVCIKLRKVKPYSSWAPHFLSRLSDGELMDSMDDMIPTAPPPDYHTAMFEKDPKKSD